MLLYHASFSEVPADQRQRLHNNRPEAMYRHLKFLKRHYTFVPIDELAASRSCRGLAAVTFDDGYTCVLEEALPVLEALKIPCTIFLNGATMEKKVFWRDKVRCIINWNLSEKCSASFSRTKVVEGLSFYGYTKHPSNNSRIVDEEIECFARQQGVRFESSQYCVGSLSDLRIHPLVTYGNHSHHHYVLSSLSRDDQYTEIEATHELLQSLPASSRCSAFSIPFGTTRDFNHDTVGILQDLGYSAALLSRNRLNSELPRDHGLTWIERFMPDERGMVRNLAKLMARSPA
ncbi:MAG: polysaccharide deacetylase family protein [Gammaproteobacteria bacterium]|nr:polysaccharide deacetylase family protein [Gammaproteobacteria bacterium]